MMAAAAARKVKFRHYCKKISSAYIDFINSIPFVEFEGDSEVDEELNLPADLRDVSSKDKRNLLAFKREHNEVR